MAVLVGNEFLNRHYLVIHRITDNYLERQGISVGMMKSLYMDFLDRVGIDPEDDNGLARFSVESGDLSKAFHEFVETKAVSIRRHKNDKIINIRHEEGDWK